MSEVSWLGTALFLLAGLLSLSTVQAQYVQLYGAGPEPYQRNLQRGLNSMSGVELANLLQRLLRDAALLRKRSSENTDGQPDGIPPGFVGARGRREDVLLEPPPGFVGARGKRASSVPLLFAGLSDTGADSPRSQIDRQLASQ